MWARFSPDAEPDELSHNQRLDMDALMIKAKYATALRHVPANPPDGCISCVLRARFQEGKYGKLCSAGQSAEPFAHQVAGHTKEGKCFIAVLYSGWIRWVHASYTYVINV